MIHEFASWLSKTPVSQFIQNVLWIIPAVQTVHILAIAVVLSSVGMVDLRILGFAGRDLTVSETADRYVPWIWGALAVLATTGLLLITGEPVRSLTNPAFQVKMALLVLAIAITAAFQVTVRHRAPVWDLQPGGAMPAKLMALLAFGVWIAIAVAGRWIAYMVVSYE